MIDKRDWRTLIVSVYYNREDMVDESIRSVVGQLDKRDLLVLVDDGSTDSTLNKLKKFEGENVFVVNKENSGFTQSISDVIQYYRSRYIAVHGAGDISCDGRFKEQVEILENNPKVGLVGSWYKDVDVSQGKTCIVDKIAQEDSSRQVLSDNPFGHSTVMFTRDVYEKSGGYRPFFKYAQDRDLWCRMSNFCAFHTIEKPYVIRYKGVVDSVSGSYKKAILQKYYSDFAVYMHLNHINGNVEPSVAVLNYSPSMELRIEMLKRAIKKSFKGDREALEFYKQHILSGKGVVFYPAYYVLLLFSYLRGDE